MKKKIAVLYGGNSQERDVSIDTANSIIQSLDSEKYQIIRVEVPEKLDKRWVKPLLKNKIDLSIIALHGGIGENGSIQGLLESLDIPFIGTATLGSALGMDKYISKELLKSQEIDVPKGMLICDAYEKGIFNTSDFPLVVKPNDDGSSFGVTIVNDLQELDDAISSLLKENKSVLVEEFIEGVEVTCGIVELNDKIAALDVLEIKSSNRFYDYEAKYERADTVITKSSFDESMQERIKETAKKVFKVLKAKDYARVDMIVKEEEIYVLEINTLPGMTSHSLLPKSLSYKNIDLSTFFDMLIDQRLKK